MSPAFNFHAFVKIIRSISDINYNNLKHVGIFVLTYIMDSITVKATVRSFKIIQGFSSLTNRFTQQGAKILSDQFLWL